MNPIDWIAWIYGKLFTNNPIIGGVVFCLGAAVIMLLLYVRAIDKYREDHATGLSATPGTPTRQAPETSEPLKPEERPKPKQTSRSHTRQQPQQQPRTETSASGKVLLSDPEQYILSKSLKGSADNRISIVTVGGTDSSALASQITEAFTNAGWKVSSGVIGSLNITVFGDSGAGRVDIHGLYLIALHPDDPAVQAIVYGFEQARHPVSLNGSSVLRPHSDITLYVAVDNKPIAGHSSFNDEIVLEVMKQERQGHVWELARIAALLNVTSDTILPSLRRLHNQSRVRPIHVDERPDDDLWIYL